MVTVRNYIPGEHLNWTREDIGYDPELLDPDVCWVVFVDGKMTALLVGAKVMGTLWLIRLLGHGRWWIRPLWRQVRLACGTQGIAGFWAYLDNEHDAERKLLTLLRDGRGGTAATLVRKAEGLWLSGRF